MTRTEEIAKAREVDERIAQQWDGYWTALAPVKTAERQITDSKKSIASTERRLAADLRDHEREVLTRNVAYYTGLIEQAEAVIKAAVAAAEPFRTAALAINKAEYTGWQRFYLVKHIHSSQDCSSFRDTTRVGWLPDVSGLTEAEAVAAHGAILCTICFPTAPTEWTEGKKDDTVCPGSGTMDYSRRVGMGGICSHCDKFVSRASYSNLSMRKHKKEV